MTTFKIYTALFSQGDREMREGGVKNCDPLPSLSKIDQLDVDLLYLYGPIFDADSPPWPGFLSLLFCFRIAWSKRHGNTRGSASILI